MAQLKTDAYLDCNATTPTLPLAADAAFEAMRTLYGNPSSSHLVGLQAKHILETTRRTAAKAIGASAEQIIFTSGATEAIQTAVFSVLETAKREGLGGLDRVLYCSTEHKAVPQAMHHWIRALGLPVSVVELPVDATGQLKLEDLRRELPRALLLATMAVNNETGVIQDLEVIEGELRRSGSRCRWLVDCVQALGKLPLRLRSSRIDYAPFSGHKLYAPKGIGFLYAAQGAPIVPLIVGGGQERGHRSGTENLPGVAALGAVLEQLSLPEGRTPFASDQVLKRHRDRLVEELQRAFPKIEFNTPFERSVPTTINFSVPGFSSKELLDLFDSAGVRLSAGSACSSTSAKPSHVLDAMGVPEWRSVSALRLSFGPCTTEAEVERGCRAIRESALALRSSCLLNTVGGFDAPESLRDGVVQLRVGPTNSWIVADRASRACVVIDPCHTVAERIESYIRCQDLRVVGVLDTHSHADHESTRPVLQRVLQDRGSDASDCDLLGWPNSGGVDVILDDGTRVPALSLGPADGGERVLARLETPGHTQDSRALLLGIARSGRLSSADTQFAFCGDTVLSGGLGRTNFVVSDAGELYRSLGRMSRVLSPRTLLCPAHDYDNSFATTLEAETRENELLRLAVGASTPETLDRFVAKKREIDSRLEAIEREFQGIVCGVAGAASPKSDSELIIRPAELQQALERDAQSWLVMDVREPQEHSLFKDWRSLGLSEAPRNVPLSRFVNFMRERLASPRAMEEAVVLVCRSGNRSLQAAKTLRRMGFSRTYSLDGGVALL